MSNQNIPKFAYVEAQIVQRAAKNGALVPYVRLAEVEHGMKKGSLERGIYFQTRVLSLLYLLIVVPKETWGLDETHPIYAQIESEWSLSDVRIIIDQSSWQNPVYRFIHHLRNSVAHANFEFAKNLTFEFWDRNSNGVVKYRAAVSGAGLERFLEVVGARLANL